MNSAPQPPGKRRAFGTLSAVAIGLAALMLLAFLWPATTPRDQLLWLTPAEFADARHVGPLTRLKYHVMNWTAPLWNTYWRNRPQISISARILNVSTTVPWPTNSPPPFVTSTNGTRAWILSPAQLKGIETEVAALPDTAAGMQSRMLVSEGISAQIASGNSTGTGANTAFSTLFCIPTTANNKVVVTFGFNHTELETNQISGVTGVKTNQDYSCRAVLPNDGGLLLENPTPEPGSSNHFWLLLNIRAVDATGRLLGQ